MYNFPNAKTPGIISGGSEVFALVVGVIASSTLPRNLSRKQLCFLTAESHGRS
jgi:hypothetical protein